MSDGCLTGTVSRPPRHRPRSDLARRFGRIVVDARALRGITKTELARRSGVSRQMIAVVEDGDGNPTLDVLARLGDALRLEIEVRIRGGVTIGGPRQRDAAHAICSGHVQRRLEAAGWETAREVPIEDGRYLGWIDLLAFHPGTGTLLIIEIKTQVDDLGAIERALDWHDRWARRAARRRGWSVTSSATWLLVLASDEVDAQVHSSRSALAASFPDRAPAMQGFVGDPGAGPVRRGLALVDPRSRRRGWLIRARIDGRRSDAPYRGYADFMAKVRSAPSSRPLTRSKASQARVAPSTIGFSTVPMPSISQRTRSPGSR